MNYYFLLFSYTILCLEASVLNTVFNRVLYDYNYKNLHTFMNNNNKIPVALNINVI